MTALALSSFIEDIYDHSIVYIKLRSGESIELHYSEDDSINSIGDGNYMIFREGGHDTMLTNVDDILYIRELSEDRRTIQW